jgi:hypothetical protein
LTLPALEPRAAVTVAQAGQFEWLEQDEREPEEFRHEGLLLWLTVWAVLVERVHPTIEDRLEPRVVEVEAVDGLLTVQEAERVSEGNHEKVLEGRGGETEKRVALDEPRLVLELDAPAL